MGCKEQPQTRWVAAKWQALQRMQNRPGASDEVEKYTSHQE
jgi:hypothetical protein